ncbi:MAG: GntR family transcriptional regulator [Mesorhizobium sp.]|uniref:GntR family transcriptional regulator n=1 Tax=Mesorhizobium sp. TaxID=1871066 RepID=UPI000FE6B536|nr:GntR family transcriptional regulator [Mesorhizobium sp.]RWM71779.1 MAG: GntR family transcriptional regulator [Mesorhizobium sp.]RWN52215.1 MAG: GntR family transcriptional regulator [Mesorhizobium sp.]RWN61092.1 MAG: GntR family transcriptional regulator [Mesorhizobium sp.]TIO13798.1 MAG: GntR family transcriptional regulator [Mesorhizobium sp.]TIR30053.1 MAG: GntR family transcriptional regulator [Mesorhizobium sp.]
MKQAVNAQGNVLRDKAYSHLCELIRGGHFSPGEKITIRSQAKAQGISPTPVREALYRLISEGILDGEANRSARIPLLNAEQIKEIKEIRILVECRAAEKAALNGTPQLAMHLRTLADMLKLARESGDRRADLALVYRFQTELYAACEMPNLVKIINSLWLKTGPYLNLLFPDHISSIAKSRGEWRERVCLGVEQRNSAVVRREVERDIDDALSYIANIVSAAAHLRGGGSRD